MTEKEIQIEVAVLKTDMSYIKSDISEIKSCVKSIKESLDNLNFNNHNPKDCENKFVTVKEIKAIRWALAFLASLGIYIGLKW